MNVNLRATAVLLAMAACFGFLSCSGGSSGGSSSAASESLPPPSGPVADFAGTWRMLGTSTGGPSQGVLSGILEVNAYGTILCGAIANVDGSVAEFTGGRVYIDELGNITGAVVSSDGVVRTVIFGRMEESRMFASFIATGPSGQELFALVRDGGSYTQNEFISGWNIFGLSSGTASEGSLHGSMEIAGLAGITGSYVHSSGSTTAIQDGTLNALSLPLGRIEGILDTSPPPPVAMDGFLSRMKDIGFINARTEVGMTTSHEFYLFVKSGGTFSTVDLAGIWSFVAASAGCAGEGVSHGTFEIDGSGSVRGGSVIRSGASTAVTGGTLSIAGGLVSGTAELAGGGEIPITSGKMDPAKSTLIGISGDPAGAPSIMIWFRQS